MNQHSSTESSTSSSVAPDAVSRRAYELWESEGRPEGCDMRHWLQAEQELAQARGQASSSGAGSSPAAAPSRNSDVNPLQGTRAAAAANASREVKRAANSPAASTEKNGNGAQAPRRKPANAPVL